MMNGLFTAYNLIYTRIYKTKKKNKKKVLEIITFLEEKVN